jgi:hypothetical protein
LDILSLVPVRGLRVQVQEATMKFPKVVFALAGIWGVAILTPFLFLFDTVGRLQPPAVSHAEYYFGFVSVGLAWQVAFLVMSTDPARYRPIIPAAMLEKFGFVVAMIALYAEGLVNGAQLMVSGTDAVWGVLFIASFVKTRPAGGKPRIPIPMNVRVP